MDHFEASTKNLVHILHPLDNGLRKSCLGTFAVMDPKLTWIPSPPAAEQEKRHLAISGVVDLHLHGLASLIKTRKVSSKILQSWNQSCDEYRYLAKLGIIDTLLGLQPSTLANMNENSRLGLFRVMD